MMKGGKKHRKGGKHSLTKSRVDVECASCHWCIIVLFFIIKIVKLLISQTVPPHFKLQNFQYLTQRLLTLAIYVTMLPITYRL